MFSAFRASKSRGILDSAGSLSSARIITVPANGGPRRKKRRKKMRRRDDGERGKTRNDAGCAAMKRGTDDAEGRQGGRGTRRNRRRKLSEVLRHIKGTEERGWLHVGHFRCERKDKACLALFGIVNFYDKYSLFHVIPRPPHAPIGKSNASLRRYRALYFRPVCRCRDGAISSFITLISGFGFITRRARQWRKAERRGRDGSRSRNNPSRNTAAPFISLVQCLV